MDFPLSPRRFAHNGEDKAYQHGGGKLNASNVLERQLLRQYAPPSVLIDENMDILYYFGETAAFLGPPEGEPTSNLIKLAKRGFKLRLRAAVQKAAKSRKPIVLSDVRVLGGGSVKASRTLWPHPEQ